MHCGQSEKRFFISPDGIRVRWMVKVEQVAFYHGWLDATEWPDDVLADFVTSLGAIAP